MAKQGLTIFQKLTKTFGFAGQLRTPPQFEFKREDILKTDSREDFEKARLQAQQTQYIADKWSKLDMSLYNQSVYYEPNRLSAYYDFESMEFCICGDTKIATPNGFITIKELSDKGKDYNFIVYSYDHNLKKIVPAVAKNAHYTRDEMTYKVIFDDDSFIIGTWEHRLMKRDGSFSRISELKEGDSMMPFYRKSFYNNENYNWVYSCNSSEGHHGWVTEHDLIAEWFYRKKEKDEEVHHMDFNGKNNLPENLKIMNINEHRSYHANIHNKKMWANPDYAAKMKLVARSPKNFSWNGKRRGVNNPSYFHIPFDLITETGKKYKTLKGTSKSLGIAHTKLQREIMWAGYKDWSTFCDVYNIEKSKYSTARVRGNEYALNHKIKSIIPYGIIPVYDLTVPGYKNFATDTIFSHNTPEISAALDIYAEESTTKSEKGQILTIHSDSKRIKHILDDLFYNIMDVNTNLPMWTRGMCKYGDDFVYLKIDAERGVIGCQQLPNIEVERLEGARQSVPNQSDRVGSRFPTRELRFTWKNKDMEFQAWEIAHFRILGDDRKLPYGTCLKSDSYIKVENGYKEIKDICINDLVYGFDVTNQNIVLSKVLDTVKSGVKTCYKISTKHNYVDVSEEHNILYYDKTDQSFKYKNVFDFEIGDLLVIDPKNNNNCSVYIDKSEPENCRNGYWSHIDSVPDVITNEFAELFGFLIGDGWISNNAVYIALGVHKIINEKYVNYLEKFSNKIVKFHGGENSDSQGICNSKMLKTILERLDFTGNAYSKRLPKWLFSSSYDIRRSFLNGLIDSDGSTNVDEWNCMRYSIELSNEELIKDIKLLVQSLGWKSGKITGRIRENGCMGNRKFKLQKKSYYFYFYESNVRQKTKYDISNRLTNDFIIEPIISIENIGEYETYDIYVENENHNFYANGIVVHNSMLDKIRRIWKQLLLAEDAMLIYRTSRAPERRVFKIFVGNMDDKDIEAYVQKIANKFKRDQVVDQKNGNVDMRYNQMAVDQDYFIPVRDPAQPSPIETLPGAQNLGEIADIEYIQKKMLAALRIPKAFLGFEDVIGNGKGLALLDIRFARTINRIQMSIIQELNKIALVHLFLLGLEDELNNFTLSMTNPSGQSDLLRIEQWKEKITMYKDATSDQSQMGILPVSHTWAKKNILGMSDNEIILDLQQQRIERAMGFELTNTQNIIRRSGIFDDVDKKYGIPEEERKKMESAMAASGGQQQEPGGAPGGGGGGGMTMPSEASAGPMNAGQPAPTGAEPGAPLSEIHSKKEKILSMLNEDTKLPDLFDTEKAQKNIYEMEKAIKDILNQ